MIWAFDWIEGIERRISWRRKKTVINKCKEKEGRKSDIWMKIVNWSTLRRINWNKPCDNNKSSALWWQQNKSTMSESLSKRDVQRKTYQPSETGLRQIENLHITWWKIQEKLIAACPYMTEHLNSVHEFLEALSPEIVVPDAVSRPVVV